MDEVIRRFPHLIESIFGRIDSESLVKCRVVGELWCNHLDAQKFFKIRMIKATVKQFHEISNAWTRVFKTATTQTILDLGEAVRNFYQRSSVLKYQNGIAPLHVASATGNLLLFRKIYTKALDRYPRDNEGCFLLKMVTCMSMSMFQINTMTKTQETSLVGHLFIQLRLKVI